ncbi:MAG: ABC transporter ATP-binding protein [Actinomycetota bacterium]
MSAPESTDAHWRALADVLRPHRRQYVALAVALGASSALLLVGPLLVGRTVDRAAEGASVAELTALAGALVGIGVAAQVASVIVTWWATRIAWSTTNELRIELAGHVLGLDHEFHRTHTPGELVQRIDGDVTALSDLLARVVPKVGGAVLTTMGMVVVLTVIDLRIGAAMLLYVAVAVWVTGRRRNRAVDESADEMSAYARLYGGIEERLTAAEDLRSNGGTAYALGGFVDESVDCVSTALDRERSYLSVWRALHLAIASGGILAVVGGAWLLENGAIALGTVFVLFQYTQLLRRPLEDVMDQLQLIQKASGGMRRVLDLRAERPTILDEGTTSPPSGALEVEFDDVDFDYGDGLPVLHDVSLRLGAGRSLGLVGRTGSGKTTMARLVLRLLETSSGEVRVGGVGIGDVPLAELRSRVAMVPQEVQLVAGSVRDNVTLFELTVPDETVAAVLRRVGLDRLVAGGLDRELGAAGAGLSAGESQLLALARVWLREPDLVVLDEATARVDPATEARLAHAVDDLLRGRTAVVIAHRLSTLERVDDIAVVDAGRVVEHGERTVLEADPTSRYGSLLRAGRQAQEKVLA